MRKPKDVKINGKRLDKILEDHQHWLQEDCDGWENMRADLHGADLSDMDLRNVVLKRADLSMADIQRSDLSCANLDSSNLHSSILNECNFTSANMESADISSAEINGAVMRSVNLKAATLELAHIENVDLEDANLHGAYLSYANLSNTNMKNVCFIFADLRLMNIFNVDFTGADFTRSDMYRTCIAGSNLTSANMDHVDLRNSLIDESKLERAKNVFIPSGCPASGSFIGWVATGKYVVCLKIPKDAKRSTYLTTRLCGGYRCDKAKVLGIFDCNRKRASIRQVSDGANVYRVGRTTKSQHYKADYFHTDGGGIDFVLSYKDAVEEIEGLKRTDEFISSGCGSSSKAGVRS